MLSRKAHSRQTYGFTTMQNYKKFYHSELLLYYWMLRALFIKTITVNLLTTGT